LNTKENRLGVLLVLTGKNSKSHYKLLLNQREIIEKQIGSGIKWFENSESQSSTSEFREITLTKIIGKNGLTIILGCSRCWSPFKQFLDLLFNCFKIT